MLPGTILWLPQRLRRMPRPTAGQPRSRSARKARRRRRKSGSAQAHACPNPAAARTLLRRRQQTLVHFALTGRTCSGVYRAALRSTTRPRGRKAPSGWRRYAHPPSASQSGLHAAPLGVGVASLSGRSLCADRSSASPVSSASAGASILKLPARDAEARGCALSSRMLGFAAGPSVHEIGRLSCALSASSNSSRNAVCSSGNVEKSCHKTGSPFASPPLPLGPSTPSDPPASPKYASESSACTTSEAAHAPVRARRTHRITSASLSASPPRHSSARARMDLAARASAANHDS
eukprot:6198141-Pleurochrysis_carterae.AAC.3